ncbi:adenosylcobinamide-GDP ribazoletransferase, partial [Oleiphilus sp. HI0067]
LQLIHYALMFYTRIPLPSLSNVDQSTQDHASRYFPLVGWLVGSTTALAFILLSHIFSQELSILLVILLGIYMTGAFHEDGLADTCDGLGGGWSQ